MWSEEETEVAAAALYAAMAMYETNFWDTCKKVSETCEAGRKFYRSFIEAIASLIYAIYDLEDLHRCNFYPKPLLDEMILFRHQLHQHQFQYRNCSAQDTCKLLLQNIDWKKYSLLTDWDVFYLIFFCTRDMDFPPKFPARNSRKGLYDDFQKAWASVKASNTFTTYDRGIELLKEFAFRGLNLQVKLREKAMEKIDFGALSQLDSKTFKKFDIISGVESSIVNIILTGQSNISAKSKLPDKILSPLQVYFFCFASDDVNDLIQLAELRRKVNGCRFTRREHFRWAFNEAKLEYSDKWGSLAETTMDAEDAADRPVYSVYMTSLLLAKSLGSVDVELEHFVFAVFCGFKLDYSDDEMATMKGIFAKCSSDGTRMRMVSFSYRRTMPSP